MNKPDDTVIKLSVTRLNATAELLSRAFRDDPLLLYLYPDISGRMESGKQFFLPNLQHASANDQIYTTSSFKGVAVWLSLGHSQPSKKTPEEDPRHKLPDLMGISAFQRLMNVVKCTSEIHHNLVQEMHYYLLFLGVDTMWQGQGIGSLIIKPMLTVADEKGITCYLETNNERNLAFYQKHDFKVGEHRQIPSGGPEVWGMVRSPLTKLH